MLDSIEQKLILVRKAIEQNADLNQVEHGLAIFRILVGLFCLIFGNYHYAWMDIMPTSMYQPQKLSMMHMFSGIPPLWFLQLIDILLIIALFFITVGIKTRWCSLFVFVLMLFMNGFQFSLGKIDHAILLLGVFLTLSFTNAGAHFALLPDQTISKKKQRLATAFFAIAIAFGMFSAGFPKLIKWIDFDLSTSGILSWYYRGIYMDGRTALLAPYFKYVPVVLVELMDYVVPIFEMAGFYFLIKSKRHWHLWLWLLCMFHLGNTLVLNIPFKVHILVYGLFLFTPMLNNLKVTTRLVLLIITPLAVLLSINQLVGRIFFERGVYMNTGQGLVLSMVLWIVVILAVAPMIFRSFKVEN